MATEKDLDLNSKLQLNDGSRMPLLGLGVYEMDTEETERCVRWALEEGYRLIDTAEWYENERPAGSAVSAFLAANPSVPRSEIFFETKLKENLGTEHVRKAVRKSLAESGLEYIDLYLIHGPLGGPEMRRQSWEVALEAKREGIVRSIGVSNYGVRHLKEICETRPKEEWPSVNQIDLHPFMRRADIVAYCQEHGIALQAWAPLVRSLRFNHPAIVALAKKHKRTPAQVLLRWGVQKRYAVIPKSVRRERIKENTQVFGWALSEEDMESLEALNENLETDWEVTTVE